MADTSWRRALSKNEIPAAFRDVYGDRSEKPASVQMAELGLEVATPLGTVNDIQASKENMFACVSYSLMSSVSAT